MTRDADPGAIHATDVELAGDILRVVHSGAPRLQATNAADALVELRAHHEGLRSFLNRPPHGNELINSCLLYPPFTAGADGALFLASRFAYAPFAGTALMAAAAVLAQQTPPVNAHGAKGFAFETATGRQTIALTRQDATRARAVWTTAAPRVPISAQDLPWGANTPARVSVVDAGLPYLVVDADQIDLSQDNAADLSRAAITLSAEAALRFPLHSLGISGSHAQYLVMFHSRLAPDHRRVTWVSDQGEIARSAGGTGALAVLAACEASGALPPGRSMRIQAPGGSFHCRIDGPTATVAAQTRISAHHSFLQD